SQIRSMGAQGGDNRTFPQRHMVEDLWVEDDRLLFVDRSRLYSVPLTGGTPELIFESHPYEPGLDRIVVSWALDREALYWGRHENLLTPSDPNDVATEWTLWR